MARTRKSEQALSGYLAETHSPLHCLVFLLPMLVAYEAGLYLLEPVPGYAGPAKIVAEDLFEKFLAAFGAGGLHLPALAIVAILVACQIFGKHPWRVHWPTLLGMTGESLLLALPLLALNQAVSRMAGIGLLAGSRAEAWQEKLLLSLGAGIYEELVFRLILISLLSFLLIDLAELPKASALAAIIVLSSLAFALQHHYPGSEEFEATRFAFRLLAGGYLASVFVLRGFAVAVGCHAFYDIIVVTTNAMCAG